MCGERSASLTAFALAAGSSPRVRGTVLGSIRWGDRPRFIPACAGNGVGPGAPGPPPAVHPRVCGERAVIGRDWPTTYGSSPRVRGTVLQLRLAHWLRRFIPACAGNGSSGGASWKGPSVHPRVCGERCTGTRKAPRIPGSSPRVRGTADPAVVDVLLLRFIPACAGNGREWPNESTPRSVHPRVCGERRVVAEEVE